MHLIPAVPPYMLLGMTIICLSAIGVNINDPVGEQEHPAIAAIAEPLHNTLIVPIQTDPHPLNRHRCVDPSVGV